MLSQIFSNFYIFLLSYSLWLLKLFVLSHLRRLGNRAGQRESNGLPVLEKNNTIPPSKKNTQALFQETN